MSDRLEIIRELPRGVLPRSLEQAWAAIWGNFSVLRDLVGYEDIEFTPVALSNTVPHKLGRVPRRWSIIRAIDITGAVYTKSTAPSTASNLMLYVVSVGSDPEMVVRVW